MSSTIRKRLLLAAQILFVGAVLWYATSEIVGQWGRLRSDLRSVRLSWSYLGASAVVVLIAYALLIETWRLMLRAWNGRLPYGEATRIWFISNLGKYVPGKVWQIAAMAVMTQQQGVSPVAATGASLTVNLANILSGFVVVLLTGGGVLQLSSRAGPAGAAVIVGLIFVGLLLLPLVLPLSASAAARLTGRAFAMPRIPPRAIWSAAVGTAVAWVLYGLAFELLVAGVFGSAPGNWTAYTAVFTSSYLVGYLALVAPGGIGVRETMLVAGLTALSLSTEPRAWLLALVSRLWLTVLEIVPGIVFIARDALRRRRANSKRHETDQDAGKGGN